MDYSLKTLNQLRPILLGFRKAAGLTQALVAARLGVTQQTYAQLEANPAAVSVERLFKVLRVLDVELALTQAARTKAKEAAQIDSPPIAAKATAARSRTARKRAASASKTTTKKRENW
ncbi:transcriptional regulator [Caballeronia temeraria]|uniref:Transcriptional regulator n=1 Tax=Caballeronia temeraria TaxID=1777137 RepID=A0A158CPW6_9BURK|nr:helix-turn-helix transcriptional regulator [Caballeronia temeraria]SAK84280.1 transcriptional regulator [Caballeronia temeraria]